MMSRHGASLAALLAPLALLVPTAAHAETVTVDDAAGDVKAINFGSALGGFFLGASDEGQPLFLDAPAETVTVSFPAACVGKPRWIQVASGAARIQITPIGDGSVNLAGWADDAFRPSLSERSTGRSPKVRRG